MSYLFSRMISYEFSLFHDEAEASRQPSKVLQNITLEKLHFTSIRNLKQCDHFSFERNVKASVIQDSRNPNNFLYVTEYDRLVINLDRVIMDNELDYMSSFIPHFAN